MTQVIAVTRTQSLSEFTFLIVSVFVFVNIHGRESPEINRIRAGRKATVVFLRIENLCCQSFPSACRTSIQESRPAFANSAELLLNFRNQFVLNRISVGTKVFAIDSVAVVVEWIGMLNLDDDEALEIIRSPLLIKVIGFLLLHFFISVDSKSGAVIILAEFGIRRNHSEIPKI